MQQYIVAVVLVEIMLEWERGIHMYYSLDALQLFIDASIRGVGDVSGRLLLEMTVLFDFMLIRHKCTKKLVVNRKHH